MFSSISTVNNSIDELKDCIPEHAEALLTVIKEAHKRNQQFKEAFSSFADLCRTLIDPQIDDSTINEMLVQYLLTERLFRTLFNNFDFINNNAIAIEIAKVARTLASHSFNHRAFLKPLDRFYVAMERAAQRIESWSERQEFLNTVYEHFFQGFSAKQADTHGIVYTPQEIVDFMVESVDVLLKQEFGKSIETPGVKILDPATGTGNFIVNIMHRLSGRVLKEKYANDLFCNEIMLWPYHIASLNIEHEYYEHMQQYVPFEGIRLTDTLELTECQQLPLFIKENTENMQQEQKRDILVVIGNPPYNVRQKNENDNNKNRKHGLVDKRISETYAKDSRASNKNALSDPYVKFFRWAADRLQGRDGIVCLVTNNSFIDQIAFDGMRMHLQKDFHHIYHLDLHGNVRKNPRLSGIIHNVFGIQVGVGLTIAIHNTNNSAQAIKYHRVPADWRKREKLQFLKDTQSIAGINWLELHPDGRHTWITTGMQQEFSTFLPIGSRDAKAIKNGTYSTLETPTIFKSYSQGVQTGRDNWTYDFTISSLTSKMKNMLATYHAELSRWVQAGSPQDIDNFVLTDETKIKWSSRLKECFARGIDAQFTEQAIRNALYRPFTRQFLYFDKIMTHRQGIFPTILPNVESERENIVIWLKIGSEWPMFALATNVLPDLLPQGGSQCFPYYTYAADGSNRHENITEWALKQFQTKYGEQVNKWDIFHYVYAMLHHPQYRELYQENLKRDLPHVPLVLHEPAFRGCMHIGQQLITMHVHYETEQEYPLREIYNCAIPHEQSLRVEKMKLSPDRTTLIISPSLTLADLPQDCFKYRLGNRSALEWVIDQYQVSQDKRSGLESDPNRPDDPEYIVRLVKQVVTVSVKTVELVKELGEAITAQDWIGL